MGKENPQGNWWGQIDLNLNQAKSWSIGERQIIVQRNDKEWLVWNQQTREESQESLQLSPMTCLESLHTENLQRYLVNKTNDTLLVLPKLANRSVIARPSSTLNVLPGEKIELYVSSPLWITLSNGAEKTPFSDLAFWQPSDSWFGTSTMAGELCYAKYTDAKVTLGNIDKRSHRAITAISISNEHDTLLTIERLNLPAPLLNLYVDSGANFWTDKVCLVHHEDKDRSSFEIKSLLHESTVLNPTLVSSSRELADTKTLMRSIRSLVA